MNVDSTTTTPASAAKQPRFAKGARGRLYEPTRLIYDVSVYDRPGVISRVLKPAPSGGQSYQVLLESSLGGRRMLKVAGWHLEALPEPPRRPAQHAYEYSDKTFRVKLNSDGLADIWCDAGGCFMAQCPVCRAHEGDRLTTASTGATAVTSNGKRKRKAAQPKEPHVHYWQPFGSDPTFEYCLGCREARRTDRLGDNPCIMLYGPYTAHANEVCATCAFAVEMTTHYDHWFVCKQNPEHSYHHRLQLHWPACARWELKPDLKRGKAKEE